MKEMNLTNWSAYTKGEVTNYNWRLNRVQVKIEGNYFINNFVDHVCDTGTSLLSKLAKIVLIGGRRPIALYPQEAEDMNVIRVYLESIKDTDIHTILISVVEDCDMFIDTDVVEDVLLEIKSVAKIEVRYLLRD